MIRGTRARSGNQTKPGSTETGCRRGLVLQGYHVRRAAREPPAPAQAEPPAVRPGLIEGEEALPAGGADSFYCTHIAEAWEVTPPTVMVIGWFPGDRPRGTWKLT